MTSILIADDHQVVLDGLQALIARTRGFEVVGTAKQGWEVIDHVEAQGAPDIILMDISMPQKDGVETMRYFQEKGIAVRVIILSMHLSSSLAHTLFGLGAKGYLQKDCELEELKAALYAVRDGETYLSKNMTQVMVESAGQREEQAPEEKAVPRLSPREAEVLRLLQAEMSSRQMAEELGISFNTVETHRKHLLNKFAVSSTVGLIREAMRCGLLD